MLRLYKQDSGSILLNNREINEYTYDSINQKIGSVFQDFSIFALPVSENILMDCLRVDLENNIMNALNTTMLESKITSLPKGLNTILSKEYEEGVELSGGEKQKLALCRIFAQDYDLVIMDEPSSALDAKAEYEFNNSILTKLPQKTVILVSHRLSTTRYVDRIIVIENGEIAEAGTHTELMNNKGRYYELFNLQSQYYI